MATRDLLDYYNDELTYLRLMGEEFAKLHRDEAAHLGLGGPRTPDPTVDRLIQAVAFLTARIQGKLDEEFPRITDALLSVVFPHAIRPTPSMGLVQFLPSARGPGQSRPIVIPAGAGVKTVPDVFGRTCDFRTSSPTTLWPIRVVHAALRPRNELPDPPRGARGALSLTLHCGSTGGFADLPDLERVRIHLAGEEHIALALHELLFAGGLGIVELRGTAGDGRKTTLMLDETDIEPIGFRADDAIFPDAALAPPGHLLIREMFSLPRKFLGFELGGLERLRVQRMGPEVEVRWWLRDPPPDDLRVSAGDFALGCAPIVNLFPLHARPIRLDRTRVEYDVVPDPEVPRTPVEVYSVEKVTSGGTDLDESEEFAPFFALRLDPEGGASPSSVAAKRFWFARRRMSIRNPRETRVSLTFVDEHFSAAAPRCEIIRVNLIGTNHALPSELVISSNDGGMELVHHAGVERVRRLTPLTEPVTPPLGTAAVWGLIARLSLGQLSLEDPDRNAAALRELLALHIRGETDELAARSVSRLAVRRGVARLDHQAMVRGLDLDLTLDATGHPPGGAFLLASVLERVLNAQVAMNSYTRLHARTNHRELHQWRPRIGTKTLL